MIQVFPPPLPFNLLLLPIDPYACLLSQVCSLPRGRDGLRLRGRPEEGRAQ